MCTQYFWSFFLHLTCNSAKNTLESDWFLDYQNAHCCSTNDYADFTALVIETTGHHCSHSIIHYCHDVSVIVLKQMKAHTREYVFSSVPFCIPAALE